MKNSVITSLSFFFLLSLLIGCQTNNEDHAEDVVDKDKANFCDWFKPSPNAFDATGKQAHDKASSSAEAPASTSPWWSATGGVPGVACCRSMRA